MAFKRRKQGALIFDFSRGSDIFISSFYALSQVPSEISQVYARSLERDAVLLTAATHLTRVKAQRENTRHGRDHYSFTSELHLRRCLSM